ncbi:PLAT domain-containing 3-like [Olea europaea subsp. europaea]|uniref:PLAT domain-containing 3-like n=1 Tax=Olea europaea subsp. europaea TaxID=158383 RepID=A0A8S0QF44_OLEEU|nr:PLAT domain-containing 3-like [Olea europaea subsp. europaea]
MEVSRFNLCFHLFILLSVFSICKSDDPDCVYTVYIRTGSIIKGGTDSIISLTLYDADGYGIRINNLESWGGLMGPGYNYFERGNLDIFSGRGPCLSGPVCKMNLTSDGSGPHHGWYVNYVEVTTTGVHKQCTQEKFTVEQWLATDASPYELTAVRNHCSSDDEKRWIGGFDSSIVSII